MVRVVAIVEGHGEAEAVPLLIRRIGQEVSPLSTPDVVKPIRVPRGSMLKTGELDRYVSLAGIRVGSDGRILILLDAHRDCPAETPDDHPRACPCDALRPSYRSGLGEP